MLGPIFATHSFQATAFRHVRCSPGSLVRSGACSTPTSLTRAAQSTPPQPLSNLSSHRMNNADHQPALRSGVGVARGEEAGSGGALRRCPATPSHATGCTLQRITLPVAASLPQRVVSSWKAAAKSARKRALSFVYSSTWGRRGRAGEQV